MQTSHHISAGDGDELLWDRTVRPILGYVMVVITRVRPTERLVDGTIMFIT